MSFNYFIQLAIPGIGMTLLTAAPEILAASGTLGTAGLYFYQLITCKNN